MLSRTNAFIADSEIGSVTEKVGKVDLDASSTAAIDADIAAVAASVGVGVGSVGAGVAIGVSVARNFIGWDPYGGTVVGVDYNTDQAPLATLEKGKKVQIIAGALAGDIYEYIGDTITDDRRYDTSVVERI